MSNSGNTWVISKYSLNYYLKPYSYSIFRTQAELNLIEAADGKTPSTAFLFIRQAIEKIYRMADVADAADYGEITATIWLFKGTDHFFFTCTKFNEDLNKDYLNTGNTSSEITNFCSMKQLHPTYPKYDNVKIIIRPLECSNHPNPAITSVNDNAIIQQECKAAGSTEKP